MKKANPMNPSGPARGGAMKGTNTGKCSGPTMSNEMRKDVTKAPSSKNPYPKGMC